MIKRKRRFRPVLVLPTGGIIKESHDQRVILVVSLASLVILIVMVIKDFLFFVSIEFKHHRHEPPFFFHPIFSRGFVTIVETKTLSSIKAHESVFHYFHFFFRVAKSLLLPCFRSLR